MGETRAAVIKHQPLAGSTPAARANQVEGKIILSLVLSTSGEATHIDVVEGLPFGLNEEAIEAARLIEFEPAMHREGRLLAQWMRVEYVFMSGRCVSARCYS